MLQAIEEHKYLQSCEQCKEIDILEAIQDFKRNHEERWLEEKQRTDNLDQVDEISGHLWRESQRAGHDIGRTAAGLDWVQNYAFQWRAQRESLTTNRFVTIRLDLPGEQQFGYEDLAHVVEEVSLLYCDVFVCQKGLENPHFSLQIEGETESKPYLLIAAQALDLLLTLHLDKGETLEIIAYGEDAEQALELFRRTTRAPRAEAI